MVVSTRAVVASWDAEAGWGVLLSADTPGGCWTHFSALDMDGYRSLQQGQEVDLEAEPAQQDGYRWRAVRARV